MTPALPGTRVDADPDAVAVGVVANAHALRGAIRLRPYQPPAPSLATGPEVLLERNGAWSTVRVASAAPQPNGTLLVQLDGVADRDAAEALRGTRVLVRAADLPPADEDEFYWHEVVGFRVETTDGETLGTVRETLSNGLHDVWAVDAGGREHLVPVVADVVDTIDRPRRRIVIRPLAGMLD
ncbi:MAG: 16S rRNA processing protein RimM [bacterium]|nr:16S rRNA processing protein RimM [bacterium]